MVVHAMRVVGQRLDHAASGHGPALVRIGASLHHAEQLAAKSFQTGDPTLDFTADTATYAISLAVPGASLRVRAQAALAKAQASR